MYMTKYRPEFCEKVIEYFSKEPYRIVKDDDDMPVIGRTGVPVVEPVAFPNMHGFAASIKVSEKTLNVWIEKKPNFRRAVAIALEHQKNILIQNGLSGGYNAKFAEFIARSKLGFRDGSEVDQAPTPLTINYTVEDARVRDENGKPINQESDAEE